MNPNGVVDNKIMLSQLLKAKSPDLFARCAYIVQELKSSVQNFSLGIRNLPDYGSQHHENVEKNIELLLPPNLKELFSEQELFVLICSVHFHGIGLLYEQGDTGEENNGILHVFPVKTYEYITDNYSSWGLNAHEASIIRLICLGLSPNEYPALPEYEILHTSKIRIRFLASLLSLAVALDIDYTRISSHILKLRKLSPASLKQWLSFTDIAGVLIDSNKWQIVVYIAPVTIEARAMLKEFVQETAQSVLDLVGDCLSANGIHYRNVETQLAHYEVERFEKVIEGLKRKYNITSSPVHEPYKFLDFFSPNDYQIFFGREGDIQRFIGYIRSNNLVVLYGESGVGKTSLINAGLIPNLIDRGFIPVYARCYKTPSDAIKEEVIKIITYIAPRIKVDGAISLKAFLEKLAKHGYEFVIFIDQFEEFFIKFPEQVRTEFIQELINCITSPQTTKSSFVISLRREYFVELGRYKTRLIELYNNAYELRKLTIEEVELTVNEPALKAGISYQDGLLKKLVSDIYHGGEFNTPHIQIVCDKLYRSIVEKGEKIITFDLYMRLGGTPKILAEYLDAEVNKFDTEERNKVKTILKEVVTSHGTKSLSTPRIISLRTGLDLDNTTNLLQELTNRCRLLRSIQFEDQVVYELAHEHLVGEVWKWLGKQEIEVKRVYELLDQQILAYNKFGILLNKDALKQIEPFQNLISLEAETKRLVLKSYFSNDPTNLNKDHWIQSLGYENAIPLLVSILESESEISYQEAINKLARIGDKAPGILINALKTPIWRVYQGVIQALSIIGMPILDSLLAAFCDPERRIRRGSVCCLAKIDGEIDTILKVKLTSSNPIEYKCASDCLALRQKANRNSTKLG